MGDDVDLKKVVLADDHPVVRDGLRAMLEAEDDLDVVAEAGDVETTRRKVKALRPAVLVLDINMPDGSGLEALSGLLEDSPTTAIVVLTMQNEPAYAREAMRSGALGYVLKQSAGKELVDAVRSVAGGETYINPQLGAKLAAEPALEPAPDDLSEREVEVLRLIALGHTNSEIAGTLYLSVRTVETHRAHIQRKLDLASRSEMVRYALDRGLLD